MPARSGAVEEGLSQAFSVLGGEGSGALATRGFSYQPGAIATLKSPRPPRLSEWLVLIFTAVSAGTHSAWALRAPEHSRFLSICC